VREVIEQGHFAGDMLLDLANEQDGAKTLVS